MILRICVYFLFLSFLTTKTFASFGNERFLRANNEADGLNILTLGGSVTWGAEVKDVKLAWPYRVAELGSHKVTNHALRAAGSFYPALCLQSILRDDETEYNVVIMEFSINGAQAFDWLIKRLRARFPYAIFIYVNLYSLRSNIVDELGRTPFDHGIIDHIESRGIHWKWKSTKDLILRPPPQVKESLKEYDCHVYNLPVPENPAEAKQFFAHDSHHLSVKGHNLVAEHVLNLMNDIVMSNAPLKFQFGTWGAGDYCDNWYKTGKIKLPYTGAKMKPILSHSKYALEFPKEGGTITIGNKEARAPLWVHYMSKQGIYPKMKVSMWDRDYYLEPSKKNSEDFYHTVQTTNIGFAETATNEITFRPLLDSREPFRLVAIGYCGACYEEVIGGEQQIK